MDRARLRKAEQEEESVARWYESIAHEKHSDNSSDQTTGIEVDSECFDKDGDKPDVVRGQGGPARPGLKDSLVRPPRKVRFQKKRKKAFRST